MAPLSPSNLELEPELLHELLDHGRNLDAYRASLPLWQRNELPGWLPLEETILLIRMGARLGSSGLSLYGKRLARLHHPLHPAARVFAQTDFPPGLPAWARLKRYEQLGPLHCREPHLQASWLTHHARQLMAFQDYEGAEKLLIQARALAPADSWPLAVLAQLHLLKRDVDRAEEAADAAWSQTPGLPLAGYAKASCLVFRGHPALAASFLYQAIQQGCQSFDLARLTIDLAVEARQRGQAQDLPGDFHLEEFLERTLAFWPLPDRAGRRELLNLRLVVAESLGNSGECRRLAEQVRIGFYKDIAKNLEENPQGKRLLLPHRQVRQERLSCFPSALATCLSALGLHVDEKAIAAEITHDGTADWRIQRWAEGKGFAVHHFSLGQGEAKALLDLGLPFILIQSSLAQSHAVAVIGYDEARGTLLFHDPDHWQLGEMLLRKAVELEPPLGLHCLLILPLERSASLKKRVLPRSRFWQLGTRGQGMDWTACSAGLSAEWEAQLTELEDVERKILLLYHHLYLGRIQDGLKEATTLLDQFPGNHMLQRAFLSYLERGGRAETTLNTLRSIIQCQALPGFSNSQKAIWPHPEIYATLARLLRATPNGFQEAEQLLRRGLRIYPAESGLLAEWAVFCARSDQKEDAALLFRLASCLDPENEAHAMNFAHFSANLGQIEQAVHFLRSRTRQLASVVGAVRVWSTLVDFLEYLGRADEAREARFSLQDLHPHDPKVAAYVLPSLLWPRQRGRLIRAFSACEKAGGSDAYSAKIQLLKARGNHLAAEALSAQIPNLEMNFYLFRERGSLLSLTQGPESQWEFLNRFPHGEASVEWWQEIVSWLQNYRPEQELAEALERAQQALPFEGWIRRQRAWLAVDWHLAKADCQSQAQAIRLIDEAIALGSSAACQAALDAARCLVNGQVDAAMEGFLRAFALEPGDFYLKRIYLLLTQHAPQRRLEVLDRLANSFLAFRGPAFCAAELMSLWARFKGLTAARAMLQQLRQRRGDDLFLLQAECLLEIQYSPNPSANPSLLQRLEAACCQSPSHQALHQLLARLQQKMGHEGKARGYWRRIWLQNPNHPNAMLLLCQSMADKGWHRKALAFALLGLKYQPDHADLALLAADLMIETDQENRALGLLETSCRLRPDAAGLHRRKLAMVQGRGHRAYAMELARKAVAERPTDPYAHAVLAELLQRSQERRFLAEAEQAWVRACALAPGNADLYLQRAEVLEFQHGPLKACELLKEALPRVVEPAGIRAELACLARRSQKSEEANRWLHEFLEHHPDHPWGWNTLMNWAKESKDVQSVLPQIAAMGDILLADPDHQHTRLEFLRQTGQNLEEYAREIEWWGRCFPEHLPLLQLRARIRIEEQNPRAAEEILASWNAPRSLSFLVESIQFRSAWKLSGLEELLVELLTCKDKNAASAYSFLKQEFGGEAWFHCAVKKVFFRVAAEPLILPMEVMEALCSEASERGWAEELKKAAATWRALPPGQNSSFGYCRILVELSSLRLGRVTLHHRNEAPQRFQEDIWLWIAYGYALFQTGKDEEATSWLADWPARLDHPFQWWITSQVVASQFARMQYDAVVATCQKVLSLSESHPSFTSEGWKPFTISRLALALLLCGRHQEFAALWWERGSLLGDEPLYRVLSSLEETMKAADRTSAWLKVLQDHEEILAGDPTLRQALNNFAASHDLCPPPEPKQAPPVEQSSSDSSANPFRFLFSFLIFLLVTAHNAC